jgi:5'-deoxynucleotidase YfbR-like HD superfamily hydrolase
MNKIIEFLIAIGKLKKLKRKGIMMYGIKNPETTADHTFRMTIMSWLLGRFHHLNTEKIIKMSLVHDLCEVYAGDITPYDGILPKDKRERFNFVRKWPRFSKEEKKKRYYKKIKKERDALEKLIKGLPKEIQKEIINLWLDYEFGVSREGRFVRQVDRVENLLEAFECWQKNKKFPTKPWWQHAEEVVDDPILLKFLHTISRKEIKAKKFRETNKK